MGDPPPKKWRKSGEMMFSIMATMGKFWQQSFSGDFYSGDVHEILMTSPFTVLGENDDESVDGMGPYF